MAERRGAFRFVSLIEVAEARRVPLLLVVHPLRQLLCGGAEPLVRRGVTRLRRLFRLVARRQRGRHAGRQRRAELPRGGRTPPHFTLRRLVERIRTLRQRRHLLAVAFRDGGELAASRVRLALALPPPVAPPGDHLVLHDGERPRRGAVRSRPGRRQRERHDGVGVRGDAHPAHRPHVARHAVDRLTTDHDRDQPCQRIGSKLNENRQFSFLTLCKK